LVVLSERVRRIVSYATLAGMLTGCYSLQPVSSASLQVGTKVAFDMNDAGRVSLGGTIGPEVGRINGLLIGKDNGEYVVAVSDIQFLRGGEQVWSGERVGIKPEYVGVTYERRFSRGRTTALSVAAVGGLAAVVATRDLLGLGTTERPVPCDTCGSTAFRIRRP